MLDYPNICAGFSYVTDTDGDFRFDLLEDGIYTLTKERFADAFELVFSEGFLELIRAINDREQLGMVDVMNARSAALRTNEVCDLYKLETACTNLGRVKERVEYLREGLIQRYGWNTWIDATRLYETFTGCPREDVC